MKVEDSVIKCNFTCMITVTLILTSFICIFYVKFICTLCNLNAEVTFPFPQVLSSP